MSPAARLRFALVEGARGSDLLLNPSGDVLSLVRGPRPRSMTSRFALCFFSVLALLFAGVARPAAVTTQTYDWKNVVIKGGGFVSGLIYHPTTPDVLYARTDVGGAFRWQPATGAWLPLNDDLGRENSQLTGVVSLALDPQDANRVYLACGQYLPSWAQNGAILRSGDRGVTWSRTNLAFKLGGNSDGRSTGERLQVDPNLGSILFLGTNQDGLWKSTDAGQTWNKVAGFLPASATLVTFDPRSGSPGTATPAIYVGVNQTTASSLYRSVDGGATWTAVAGAPSGLLPHHARFAPDGMLYLTFNDGLGPNGVTGGAVWKFKPADGTWTDITPPTGQGGFAGLALDALHPGTLVVTTLNRWSPRDEIYRSTDAGATWKALNALSTRDGSSAPYSTSSTPHWMGDIEIDPFNAGRAFYITGYGIFGTGNLTAADANGKIAWNFSNDGLEETVPLGLASPPSGAPLVSVLGDIDGFRHDDLTVSPTRGRHVVSVGTNLSLDFAALAPENFVRTHGGGTTRGSRSVDGGATWSYFASAPAAATADAAGHLAISADGSRMVWAPTRATAYVSSNQGLSWSASGGGPPAAAGASYVPVSDRVNAAKFYVYDSLVGRVYASTDGGNNFGVTASGLPLGAEPLRATFGKEGHLWLPAGSSGVYRSTNSAATFAKVAGVEAAYRIGFGQAAAAQTYPAIFLWGVVQGVTGFFRSDDEAGTWIRINDSAHQFGWINALSGDPRVFGRVYLATGGRGIVYGDLLNAVPTVVWSTPSAVVQGTALSSLQLNAAANIPGTFSYSPAGGTVMDVGVHPLSVTFTPTDQTHYSTTTAQVNLTVVASGGLTSSRLVNIATRAYCGVGNNVTIGGFVITGSAPKRVLLRAVGPTLTSQGIGAAEVLQDPTVKVYSGAAVIAENDDWTTGGNAPAIAAVAVQIGASPLALTDAKSAALILDLMPGVYSFVASGKNAAAGIVLLEVYDADVVSSGSTFVNIATRAYCTTGNGVTIGGFVISGSGSKQILLRALGTTLTSQGIEAAEVLADPGIELYAGAAVMAANDDWGAAPNAAAIAATGARIGATAFAATDVKSSALLLPLPAGVYSFIARGRAASSGIVLVEVYDAD